MPEQGRVRRLSRGRLIGARLALFLLSALCVLLAMEIALRLSGRLHSEPYPFEAIFSSEVEAQVAELVAERADRQPNYALGWDFLDRQQEEPRVPGLVYHWSDQATRGTKRYDARAAPGILRIAAFGDSYTFGQCLPDDRHWAPLLEQRFAGRAEVLNFGVNGYGTDQALLKYLKRGASFHPDIVVLGVYADNFFRNVNMFRYIYTNIRTDRPVPKPRFVLRDGALELIEPVPVSRLHGILSHFDGFEHAQHEYFYDPTVLDRPPLNRSRLAQLISYRWREHRRSLRYALSPGTEPFETTLALVERFDESVRLDGATPLTLLIPSYSVQPFAAFRAELDARGIRHVDLSDALLRDMKATELGWGDYTVPKCFHFNDRGARIMADTLFEAIESLE